MMDAKCVRKIYTRNTILPEFHLVGLLYIKELEDLPSQGKEEGSTLRIAYFLENYNETDDWQGRHIRGRCFYVVVLSKAENTCLTEGISWYHRMCNVINEVSQ